MVAAGAASIIGLGSAFPAQVAQDELWRRFFGPHFGYSRAAERIFTAAGVRTRHAVVNPIVEDISSASTGERMRRYAQETHPLGKQALATALAGAGLTGADVGLLTVASCTGYGTPGVDVQLAATLGMPATTRRLLVGHMGCYAALPGLAAVADFVVARGRPAALLCVELTSLHVQPATRSVEQIVAHALFSDGAAAVVVAPDSRPGGTDLRLLDFAAVTDPASAGHMTWEITDLGFQMGLSPQVPDVLARHVRPAVAGLLAPHGLRAEDVAAWVVHPGGPRILDTVHRELDLAVDALAASREVLADHGNCSSATVLVILERLCAAGQLPADGTVVMMAFGPGLTLYLALLQAGPRSLP